MIAASKQIFPPHFPSYAFVSFLLFVRFEEMSSHKPLAINDDSQAEGQWDVGGSSSLLQRTTARWKQTIYQMDWKQFAINNGLLFTLLILSTAQLVLAKKTSARLKNYPFSLAQAQPVITSTLFGILYLCSLAYASIQNLYFPEDSTDCSSGDEKSRLIDSSEKNATTEEEQTWYWWTKLYFHLAVVGTFLSIGNILQFSGLRGDYVPVKLPRLTIINLINPYYRIGSCSNSVATDDDPGHNYNLHFFVSNAILFLALSWGDSCSWGRPSNLGA